MIPETGHRIEVERCALGASSLGEGRCQFLVWAPYADSVAVRLQSSGSAVPMAPDSRGYHRVVLDDVVPGTHYQYVLNGAKIRPDPASRFQPEGVHGPSAVVDSSFPWTDDAWRNPPLAQYVFYEVHVGAFSAAGTFDAIEPHLRRLKDLGITVLELMPVSQFPGNRNWGYDGVYPFAVQNSYGGPEGLRRLVDACHQRDMAVV